MYCSAWILCTVIRRRYLEDKTRVQGDTWNVATGYEVVYQRFIDRYIGLINTRLCNENKHTKNKNKPTLVLEMYLISYWLCYAKRIKEKNWKMKLCQVVVLGVTGSASGTPHSCDWRSGNQSMWFSAMRTGMNSGSLVDWCRRWVYRRRDHLICSLADWRTCRRKLGLTELITPTTKV